MVVPGHGHHLEPSKHKRTPGVRGRRGLVHVGHLHGVKERGLSRPWLRLVTHDGRAKTRSEVKLAQREWNWLAALEDAPQQTHVSCQAGALHLTQEPAYEIAPSLVA